MEKNERAQSVLAEVKILEKIIAMYLEYCKGQFEQHQTKLLDTAVQIKVDCFYKPSVEAINSYVDGAKKYADCYKIGQNVNCTLQSIEDGYNEIIFTHNLSEENNAWSLANSRGEILLGVLHESEEYPVVMNIFIEEYFSKLKDNGIVFYVDNDEENKGLFELLKDLGIIKSDKEVRLYEYCIEYAKKNPELASKCFQTVDIVCEELRKL